MQPINKTIGINKHGTLLSSQTTDTPGTKQNQTVPSSLRSNFSNLPELGSFSKSAFPRFSLTLWVPTCRNRTLEACHYQAVCKGSVAIFPLQRRRLVLLYTPHGLAPNRPFGVRTQVPGGAWTPVSARISRELNLSKALHLAPQRTQAIRWAASLLGRGVLYFLQTVNLSLVPPPGRASFSGHSIDDSCTAIVDRLTSSSPTQGSRGLSAFHLLIRLPRIDVSPEETGDSLNDYERHRPGS
ncbi:hypothetical protein IWX64_003435 [Arthrobacter sp. CAN_A212]